MNAGIESVYVWKGEVQILDSPTAENIYLKENCAYELIASLLRLDVLQDFVCD